MKFFQRKKRNTFQSKIVVDENPASESKAGYTRLKDNILSMNADGKCQVIQIESSLAHEAKTTILANLAVSLGLTEKKVVIVDLDFRCPRLHRIFEMEKEIGVKEYIQGEKTLEDIIKQSKYKNVSVVSSGEEVYNPSLIYLSDKFAEFIKILREKYDYVLLDCAPILQTSDYLHISKISDGVLFVVAYGRTTKGQVIEATNLLKKNGINIFGMVFSMYDSKKDKEYAPYYKYYGEEN